jgi:hypothetical protein
MNYPIKPHFYERKPEPSITEMVAVKEIRIHGDEKVDVDFLGEGEWYFDRRTVAYQDYDEYFLVQYETKTKPNVNYENQLKRYNVELENFNRLMAKYDAELVVFNKWQADQTEKIERAHYEALKAKFEPKA